MGSTTPTAGGTDFGGTTVPAEYAGDVTNAATALGLPPAIVAAQIQYESDWDPTAVSSAGAEGIAQFLPGTFKDTGVGGSPFNVSDAFAAYVKYMGELLKQEKGSVFNALAAYNAGPGNLSAGDGYAQHIFSQAGYLKGLEQGGTGQITGFTGGATEGGTAAAGTPTGTGPWTSALGDVYGDVSSGLLTWPGSILGTIGDIDKLVGKAYAGATLFFKPSTYVRIGAGIGGAVCLTAALVFLVKEAK